MASAKILMVVTSHGDIDDVPTTGIWFTEFSEPFEEFVKAGAQVAVASPRGGAAPVDPRGYPSRDEITKARDALATLNATTRLGKIRAADFDAVFFPGGHGPMFDLAGDATAKQLIADFWGAGKPVAAVCHGPAALLDVKLPGGKTLLAMGRIFALHRPNFRAGPYRGELQPSTHLTAVVVIGRAKFDRQHALLRDNLKSRGKDHKDNDPGECPQRLEP